MVLAARLSSELGHLHGDDAVRAARLIERAGLPVAIPDVTPDIFLEHMARDKKNEGGTIKLILLSGIGNAYVDSNVPVARIHSFLRQQGRISPPAVR